MTRQRPPHPRSRPVATGSARADLEVPAGKEAVARVRITPEGLEALEREGDDPESVVTIPLVDESQPVSFSDFLTILAP